MNVGTNRRKEDPRMSLSLKSISRVVNIMDETYDANFGEWVRNEDNCKIIGVNMRKYIDRYKPSEFIIVVKWIVRDWTLRSIILFSKKLILDDLSSKTTSEYTTRIKILTGFVYTWNPLFIAEFLLASTTSLTQNRRAIIFADILQALDTKKVDSILTQIEERVDDSLRTALFRQFSRRIYGSKKSIWNRTESLVNAFTLL